MRRNRAEQALDLLSYALQHPDLSASTLCSRVHLNWNVGKKLIDKLEEQKLVQVKNSRKWRTTLRVTGDGCVVLADWRRLKKRLGLLE